MGLVQLIYTSRATCPVTPARAVELLHQARERNIAQGITGALLHDGQSFAQLLEGSAQAVNETFRRIIADPRHTDVTLLLYASTSSRSCDGWSMHYVNEDPGFASLISSSMSLDDTADTTPEALGGALVEFLATRYAGPGAVT